MEIPTKVISQEQIHDSQKAGNAANVAAPSDALQQKNKSLVMEKSETDNLLSEFRHVTYKKSHQMDGKDYIIEISRSAVNPKERTVTAYSILGKEQYSMTLPERKVGNTIEQAENVAKCLRIKYGRLILAKLKVRSKSVVRGPIRSISPIMMRNTQYEEAENNDDFSTNIGFSFDPMLVIFC